MSPEPQEEHRWLARLVGEWTWEAESVMKPGEPPTRHAGTESARPLGDLWVVCEWRSETPGGGTDSSLMTLGYDPERRRFVGSFVSSMMTHLWIYDGELDPSGQALVLDTEGPSFTAEGGTGRYRDVIELRADGGRVMTSSSLGDDGEWHRFMTMTYRRAGSMPAGGSPGPPSSWA